MYFLGKAQTFKGIIIILTKFSSMAGPLLTVQVLKGVVNTL